LSLQAIGESFDLLKAGQGGGSAQVFYFEGSRRHTPTDAAWQIKTTRQPVEQTRAEGIPGAGGIDRSHIWRLDGKTVSLRIEGMYRSGTIGGDNNSPGYGLQLSGVLTNIDTWETLTYIRA
jgi:hypothetical protein